MVGKLQTGFEKTDRAEILNAVDVETRAAEIPAPSADSRAEAADKRQIMHGHDGGRSGAAPIVQVRRDQAGLPIVHVHDIGAEPFSIAPVPIWAPTCERAPKRKALSGQSLAVGTRSTDRRARAKVRGVEDEEIETGRLPRQHARPAAEEVVELQARSGRGTASSTAR